MTREEMKSDLAYLREMAEAGQNAPYLGGRFALWWGALACAVLIGHWAIMSDALAIGPNWLWWLWLGFVVIGSAGSALLGMGLRGKPGRGSPGNRAGAAVWQSVGLVIFTYFLGVTAGVLLGRLSPVFFNTILPVALLGYACAWLTTAMMTRSVTLAVPGLFALAGGFASIVFVAIAEVYLIAAGAVLLSTVLPGLVMMRGEPKDVV